MIHARSAAAPNIYHHIILRRSHRNRRIPTSLRRPLHRRPIKQRMAASRTRRVRTKPSINATHMKSMVTLWQHSHLLTVGELSETNRTISGQYSGLRSIHGHRNLSQCSLLKSSSSQPRCSLLRRLKRYSPATP